MWANLWAWLADLSRGTARFLSAVFLLVSVMTAVFALSGSSHPPIPYPWLLCIALTFLLAASFVAYHRARGVGTKVPRWKDPGYAVVKGHVERRIREGVEHSRALEPPLSRPDLHQRWVEVHRWNQETAEQLAQWGPHWSSPFGEDTPAGDHRGMGGYQGATDQARLAMFVNAKVNRLCAMIDRPALFD